MLHTEWAASGGPLCSTLNNNVTWIESLDANRQKRAVAPHSLESQAHQSPTVSSLYSSGLRPTASSRRPNSRFNISTMAKGVVPSEIVVKLHTSATRMGHREHHNIIIIWEGAGDGAEQVNVLKQQRRGNGLDCNARPAPSPRCQ